MLISHARNAAVKVVACQPAPVLGVVDGEGKGERRQMGGVALGPATGDCSGWQPFKQIVSQSLQ